MTNTTHSPATRLVMIRRTINLPQTELNSKAESLLSTDGEALGKLMYRAYKDTIDDEGETQEESIKEAQATLQGKYGPVIFGASFIIKSLGMAVSAVVVTDYPETGPLIAFALTDPDYQKRGLASRLISLSLEKLARLGISQVRLVVTSGNAQAVSLYRRLGFEIESVKKEKTG